MQRSNGTGRLAMVTGAAGGLGRRFCRVLGEDGFAVGLGGRERARLEALQAELEAAGIEAVAVPFEPTSSAAVGAAMDGLEQATGKTLSVLVNSIGTNRRGPLLDAADEDFDLIFNANVRSAFLLAREAARRMILRGEAGRIVQVSSIMSHRPVRDICIYGASKAALTHLTQCMALEWGPHGISVNALLPGFIETDLTRKFLASERGREITTGAPRGRFGQPSDLDGALRLLTSFETDFINGSALTVDDAQSRSIR
jgi:NAD(P)-dependent dehydrogenase (short-subunit alcohol dehydrogenase family)